MDNLQRGYVSIDLDAVVSNMNNMKANIAPNTKMLGVIKTDGYGHGAIPIAKELEKIDYVWGYATATVEEALAIREADCDKPILVLGYTFPYAYESMLSNGIRPATFRIDQIDALDEAAGKLKIKAPIHIKVDTGMSRIGITPDDAGLEVVSYALGKKNLLIEGVFTHMARADEVDKKYANLQISKFCEFCNQIENELGFKIPIKHCSNSAGIVEIPEANLDLVRAGITLYGLWPSDEVRQDITKLTPVLSWYSSIVFVKTITEGTQVSYGGTYVAEKTRKIATVPVGYGDGYPRGLSGKGHVLIRGQRVPIIGRVCMDQFMVDVTDIEGVSNGDKVTLIGYDGKEHISMEELGKISGRFNYELACDIGKRMPRVYMKNGEKAEVVSSYCLL